MFIFLSLLKHDYDDFKFYFTATGIDLNIIIITLGLTVIFYCSVVSLTHIKAPVYWGLTGGGSGGVVILVVVVIRDDDDAAVLAVVFIVVATRFKLYVE